VLASATSAIVIWIRGLGRFMSAPPGRPKGRRLPPGAANEVSWGRS
jgi:hypothetical protein